jgi:hypothetical protein
VNLETFTPTRARSIENGHLFASAQIILFARVKSLWNISPVIQSYEQDGQGRVKVRICDKAAAGAQLAKMCGWNEPDKVEMSADSTSYLLELRSRSLGDHGQPVEDFTVAGDRAVPIIAL